MTRTSFALSLIFALVALAGFPALSMADQIAEPMDGATLAATAGGSEASITSVVSNNEIGYVGATGGIQNVYATGNSGLTTLIENTGNQVSISTATVVNVTYH